MKILIIGNIAAGKSSLIDKLINNVPELKNYKIIKIDDFRIKYGDGSFSKEYLSLFKFFEKIENMDSMIIEFSGAGPYKYSIKQSFLDKNNKVIVIQLSTNITICTRRNKERILKIPYPWNINPIDMLDKISEELNKDWINGFWSIFRTIKSNDFNKIKKYIRSEIND